MVQPVAYLKHDTVFSTNRACFVAMRAGGTNHSIPVLSKTPSTNVSACAARALECDRSLLSLRSCFPALCTPPAVRTPCRGPRCVCHAHGMSKPICKRRLSTLPPNGTASRCSPSVRLRGYRTVCQEDKWQGWGWGAGRGPGSCSRRVAGGPKLIHKAFQRSIVCGNINSHRGPPLPPASSAHSKGPTTVDGSQEYSSRKPIHPKEKTRAPRKDQDYPVSLL